MGKRLIVIAGPTGVGKSELSIALAQCLSAPIVSCDSRQIYKEMRIGTAVPTTDQLNRVKHYFIQTQEITCHYSAGDYERDAIKLLDELFLTHDDVLMVGGSGLYINAVCNGIDDIPAGSDIIRTELRERIARGELPQMAEELRQKDPVYYEQVDKENPQRVSRALEVILTTGEPFSSFRKGEGKKRAFDIIKIGINRPREELYERINRRVDEMMEEGLLEEATALYPQRHHNALQTVGYREFFDYIDGKTTLSEAVELLKRNTRHYAKRQMTWFGKDKTINWLTPKELEAKIKNSNFIFLFT